MPLIQGSIKHRTKADNRPIPTKDTGRRTQDTVTDTTIDGSYRVSDSDTACKVAYSVSVASDLLSLYTILYIYSRQGKRRYTPNRYYTTIQYI